MKAKINLATKRVVQVKKLRKFFLSSVIFFGIATGATLILLIVNFFTNLQIANLSEEQAALEIDVARYKSVKDTMLGTQERLGQIRSLLSERQDVGTKVSSIVGIVPSTIKVKSVQYDTKDIRVSISSPSLSALNSLIEEKLAQLEEIDKKFVGQVTVGDFQVDTENQEYATSFSISQVQGVEKSVLKKEINKDE